MQIFNRNLIFLTGLKKKCGTRAAYHFFACFFKNKNGCRILKKSKVTEGMLMCKMLKINFF